MDSQDEPRTTRRGYLGYGGAVLAGGLLAGCSGDDGDGANPTPRDTTTHTAAPGTTTGRTPSSYSVAIEPVGEVEFESVPEVWVANNGSWADMGIALGLEPPEAVWLSNRYHTHYYDEVPGVSVDGDAVASLYDGGVSEERFYAMDADVHVVDPNFLLNRFTGWDRSMVEDITESVGPFFGNCSYAQHYPWHEDYRYYTLDEAFEKLAQVFQRTDRYDAFEAIRDDFRQTLAPVVPSPGERPAVAVLWGVGEKPEEFYPYVIGGGTSFTHFRDLGVRDALASTDIEDFHGSRASIDLETVLEIDPEVLVLRGYENMDREGFRDTVVSFLQDHDTARALTAVENGDVYRAGGLYQGPITSMVLTERTARQLYDVDEELFDREAVADVVAGDV